MPPVLHRDLKSRNILLNKAMEAKLTGFGTSRERLEYTMTAGVGTSLWMAPGVMLGEKYDVKADMFSFGVVLSELDTHKLPYTNVKQTADGHVMADASLLQPEKFKLHFRSQVLLRWMNWASRVLQSTRTNVPVQLKRSTDCNWLFPKN